MDSYRPVANWEMIHARAAMLRQIRNFFENHDFLEVETPILSSDIVIDRHLDPFYTKLSVDPRRPEVGQRLWLQTSPEAAMKRLMASIDEGEDDGNNNAIYQITRSFRNAEEGKLHNPEFTILEWYRRGDAMQQAMQLLSQLCAVLLDRGQAVQISYQQAFQQFAQVDPHRASIEELKNVLLAKKVSLPDKMSEEDRDSWLDLLLVEMIQGNLGFQQPTILYDYPASQAALAKVRLGDPAVAERFELFVDGVELANGYHELTDATELSKRFDRENQLRTQDRKPPLPTQSRLLEAMQAGLPDCAGVAVGVDRFLMIATGATSIDQVLTFPINRA